MYFLASFRLRPTGDIWAQLWPPSFVLIFLLNLAYSTNQPVDELVIIPYHLSEIALNGIEPSLSFHLLFFLGLAFWTLNAALTSQSITSPCCVAAPATVTCRQEFTATGVVYGKGAIQAIKEQVGFNGLQIKECGLEIRNSEQRIEA